MDDRDSFKVCDLDVSLEIELGEAGNMTAIDPKGDSYEGGFLWERIGGGKCMICRRINGEWICQDVLCAAVEIDAPTQEMA